MNYKRRAIGLLLFSVLCILLSVLCSTGCSSPLISSDIHINDSLNNNEIPLIK